MSEFQTSPPGALFGARSRGEVVEETLTLHSLSNQRFEVIGVKAEGDGLVVQEATTEMADNPTFVVKQRIMKTGQEAGRIVFQLRTERGKDVQLFVAVTYLGIPEPEK